jgi:hypothetical protein
MEKAMVESAAIIWADGPSSAPANPPKAKIRAWGKYVETALAGAAAGATIYDSKADMVADTSQAANAMAWVLGDATAANNGVYQFDGTSTWTRLGDLPYSYITATNAGAGTADAIVATTSVPIPATDGGALIALPIVADNTGTVTVAFNSGTALTIKTSSGSDIAFGGLTSGVIVAGFVSGSTFRLLSDQASAAIQAAAEAAQVAAETARSEAEAAQAAAEAAAAGAAGVYPVADRTVLKTVDPSAHAVAYLMESGREGTFKWDGSDLSAKVTADTAEGIYVAPVSDTTGASGAWVRQAGWHVMGADARWFGLVADYDPVAKTGTAAEGAINAALAVVPWVRLPDGNILLSDMVTLDGTNEAKKLTGAGRRLTAIYVNSGFNLTDDAIINLTGGEAKHTLGNFSVICQDQPDSATLADYVAYPPVILANTQPRFKIESMRIMEAYVGIDMRGNSGGAVIDDLELSSFYRGIRVDGSLDSVKISRLHFWPFNFSGVTNKRSVYHDSRGIELGRADDFHLNDTLLFGCRYGLYTTTGTGGSVFGTLNSVDFDASGGLYMTAGQLFASNCVFTLGDVNSQMVYIGSGALTVASSYFLNSAVSALGGGIDVLGGTALFSGCYFHGASADNYIIRAANAATCGVSGSYFYRNPTTTFTKQAIIAAGTGVVLNANGNTMNDMTTGSSLFILTGSTTMGGEAGNHYGAGWSSSLTNGTSFRSDRRRSYTPTVTAGSGALTSVTGQTGDWSQVGDTVYFRARATITTNGTGATSLKFTLPKDNAASAGCPVSAISSSDGKALAAVIGSGTNVITVTNVDGTYPGADGKVIIISGSYQAA